MIVVNTTILNLQEQRVLKYVDENWERIVPFLQDLLSYPTITPQYHQSAKGDAYINFQKEIAKFLQTMGVEEIDIWEQDSSELEEFPGSGILPDRDLSKMPVLVATLKGTGSGKSLILNGHYDVVPAGDPQTWMADPFSGEVRAGKIYGRGSCDMKGGIAAMLFALKFLQEMGVNLKGDVIVQTVPDEEMTCMGTLSCCQRGYSADAAFIPEPTDMKVLIAMRGSQYGQIKVFGRSGHAEMAHPHWEDGGAVNAIEKAQLVLQAIEELNANWRTNPEKHHKILPPDSVVPIEIRGGGDWSVTFPEEVRIGFGVIFQPSMENAIEEFENMVFNISNKDSWLSNHPPEISYEQNYHYGAEVEETEAIVQLGLEILHQLDYPSDVCGFGSLTDAIHLINRLNIPTISIGPDLQPAHMVNEYIDVQKLVDLTKVITLLLIRWCGVSQ